MARKPRESRVEEGKVRVHDPFELVRWLALSQPDPRKALAELVQNSLDANARHIRIVRVREKGIACLKIHDDGEGVIPELERPDALRYIATHIGHSRKRSLSPQERWQLMTQGQYGIGLLGFWSLGEMLEIRSSSLQAQGFCADGPYYLVLRPIAKEYQPVGLLTGSCSRPSLSRVTSPPSRPASPRYSVPAPSGGIPFLFQAPNWI